MENLARKFYVSGTVQGVGFRYFVERAANRLGIAGYVKNCFDGRVKVYAIGGATQLESLKDELGKGPRMAKVSEVTELEAEILTEYLGGFSIDRDD
jgi:acylphosphatase